MTTTKTAATVLREARELLVRDGWCQGEYRAGNGRLCLVGAVFSATPYPASALGRLEAIQSGALGWNDAPGRTVDEVLALLDRAIGEAEREEP